jgi:hypothetical protein
VAAPPRTTTRGLTSEDAPSDAGPNTAPTPNPQSLTTDEDVPLPITLTGTHLESDPLTFAVATQPAHGALSNNAVPGATTAVTPAGGDFVVAYTAATCATPPLRTQHSTERIEESHP